MRFTVKEGLPPAEWWTVKVGNAYAVGPNSKAGTDKLHLRVLIGLTKEVGYFLTLERASGSIVGFVQKPASVVERMIPIGIVPGLDELRFDVTPFQIGAR